MPLGSGFAHPKSSGKSLDRVLEVGAEPVQAQGTPVGVLRLRSFRWSCADLGFWLQSPLSLSWWSEA